MATPRHMKPSPQQEETELHDSLESQSRHDGARSQVDGDAGGKVAAESDTSKRSAHPVETAPKSRAFGLKVALVVLITIALCGGGYLVWQQGMIGRAASEAESRDVPENPPASDSNGGEEQLPDNPIDFNEVRSKNNDVYAWLYVPGTEVNVPILQSPADDTYYLTHDAEKQEDPVGAVFTQLKNKTDFSDPVTVVYGHDVDGLFKTLHDYEDANHFNANKTFYIYRPGHILTYTLVSAYKYDDRHILNSFDFSQPDVLSRYFDFVQNPDSLLKNVNPDVTLDANSKIVQLSTCMLNEFHGNSRFIVTGVLVNDQETK